MKNWFFIITTSFVLIACSKSELHESMEDMGDSFKAMRKLDSVEEIKAELDKFSANLDIASQQMVEPDDQSTFDEGMKKLQEEMNTLYAALEADDLDAAKQSLKVLHDIHEDYHEKLEVEDD